LLHSRYSDCLFVAESGYSHANDCQDLFDKGFNGVLIGEGLVKSESLKRLFI